MRDAYIPAFPPLRPGTLLRRPVPRAQREPWWEDALLASSARAAAFRAVRLLRIARPATILVPSYHCGVEIEAILRAGADIEYYAVPRTMQLEPERLAQRLGPRVRALFVIHYWGFPQELPELSRICRERNVLMIEDCAHALFSGSAHAPLGSVGDAALFSLPKSLPVPDGGALRMRGRAGTSWAAANGPGAVAYKAALRSLLDSLRSGKDGLLSRTADRLVRRRERMGGAGTPRLEHHGETRLSLYDRGISAPSRYVLHRVSGRDIVRRRRANYLRLLDELGTDARIQPVFPRLEEGTCPLFLPVVVDDRDGLEAFLREQRIGTFVFGRTLHSTLDRESFADAVFLSSHVLGLPVHQGLEAGDLRRIARETRRWLDR